MRTQLDGLSTDSEGGFELSFELPSGAYATTLLRELFVEVVAATGVEAGSSSSS